MVKRTLMLAAMLALSHPAQSTPKVSGDGACGVRAVDNESFVTCEADRAPEPEGSVGAEGSDLPSSLPVTARRAWRIKKDLGTRALLVDIRARAEIAYTGMPLGVDANVPFMEPSPRFVVDAGSGALAMEFDARFPERMDALLDSAGLRHGDPVILLCGSGECSRVAAELMREHGYLQVFAITDGFEGRTASAEDRDGTRREEGWKNAGLPWTFRLDSRWLHADDPGTAR